jgi:Mg2+-importing ATPase
LRLRTHFATLDSIVRLAELVVRTRRPFFRSRPGKLLLLTTVILAVATPAIPFLPFADTMGFVPLPPTLFLTVVLITACYVLAAEVVKKGFYREQRG